MKLTIGDMKRTKRSRPRTEPWGTPVHMVVLGEDVESILTKDVRLVRAGIARHTESMLKSVEKCGIVERIKCSGHVESSQNCNFSRVNGFHDVICEFEQSGLS